MDDRYRQEMVKDRLFPKDLAKKWNVSVRTAHDRLRALEREHGAAIVRRVGRGVKRPHRYTTHAAIARLEAPAQDRERRKYEIQVLNRLRDLEETKIEFHAEIVSLRREIMELKRKIQAAPTSRPLH